MASAVRIVVSPLSIIDKDLGKLGLQIVAVVAMFIPGGQPIAAAAALALAVLYKPKGPKPEQQERSLKSSIPSRLGLYGKARLYGASIAYATNEEGYSVDVWAFHEGRVNAVLHRYLGDKIVHTNAFGYVINQDKEFGEGSDTVSIGNTMGLPVGTAFSEVVARLPGEWTSSHRGDGVVTGYMTCAPVKSKQFNDTYPQGSPDAYPLSMVMEGQLVYDWRDPSQNPYDESTWKYSDNGALCTAHYLMNRASKDWDTNFAPALSYWTSAANVCDEAFRVIRGGAILTRPSSQNSSSVELMNVDGLRVGTVIRFSQLNHTATVTGLYGLNVGFSPPLPKEIKAGSYVSWTGSWTQPKYRVALAHKYTEAHKIVIGNLLACWDGMLLDRGDGVIIPWAGKYVAPDPADLIGPDEIVSYSWDFGVADEDQFNCIAVTYISDNHNFTVVDTDEWRDENDIMETGEEKKTGLENSVPSHAQARFLAKRLVSKTMAANRGSITTNIVGKKIRGKRFIPLHIEEAGSVFFSGTAEIVRIRRNLATGGVSFDWISADPNVDSWNPATEEGFPAPVTNPVSPPPAPSVSIDTASAVFAGDNNTAFIEILVDAPDRDDLTWFGGWKLQSNSVWSEQQYTDIDPSSSVLLSIGPVPIDSIVEVKVSYSDGKGSVAEWSSVETVSTATALIPPGIVTDVTSLGGVGKAEIAWRNPTTSNYAATRLYRNTTNNIATAVQVAGDFLGALGSHTVYDDTVTAGTYYYWLRSVSVNNILSAAVATGSVTVT